jgi:hypothetical protein
MPTRRLPSSFVPGPGARPRWLPVAAGELAIRVRTANRDPVNLHAFKTPPAPRRARWWWLPPASADGRRHFSCLTCDKLMFNPTRDKLEILSDMRQINSPETCDEFASRSEWSDNV